MLEKILSAWKFISETLIYIVFPPICPVCQEIMDDRGDICPACLEKILYIDFSPMSPAPIEKVMRITKYRGGTRDLLRKLKFENSLRTLPTLKIILESAVTNAQVTEFLKGIDVAVYVPLHEKRLKERGYNQTELIFSDWLRMLKIPAKNILIRSKKTPHLYNLTPAERRETLKGAFETVDGANIKGKNVLILDDIFTTGATATECAKELKKIGAAQIFMLAFSSDFGAGKNA